MSRSESPSLAAVGLSHSALDAGGGVPPGDANLTDRQRVAVLLQAAALLAHLEHLSLSLVGGLEAVTVSSEGQLRASGLRHAPAERLAQTELRILVRRLFRSDGEIPGRGEARRVARLLTQGWIQELTPLSGDTMVAEILDRAPFLWQPAHGVARQALLAEHRHPGRRELWVCGPGFLRRRLLGSGRSREEVAALLAGDGARKAWSPGAPSGSELAAAGRWPAAVRAFGARPPSAAAECRVWAEGLFQVGRFEDAIKVLRPLVDPDSRLLRIRCLAHLGRLPAAARALRLLPLGALDGRQMVELGDIAVRVAADRGDRDTVRDWVARLMGVRGPHRSRGRLIAALGCWELHDLETMERILDSVPEVAADPESAWRYHQGRALLAATRADGDRAVAEIFEAMAKSRRLLRPFEAGQLWNDMVVARVSADDLAGAERACRHCVRLLGRGDGPSRATLAWWSLAEIRIRRGRLPGVRAILEHSSRENRRSRNVRGSAHDAELWARFELARGRPEDALGRCYEGLDRVAVEGIDWNRGALEALEARALGWLGRTEAARQLLDGLAVESLNVLEPEEVPVTLAQAGLLDRARALAEHCSVAVLLVPLLDSGATPPSAWNELRRLEPYRASRLVYDCALLWPAAVPDSVRSAAAVTLSGCGAEALGERLDAGLRGPWRALAQYLDDAVPGAQGVERFLRAAGHPQASLVFEPRLGSEPETVVTAAGGTEQAALDVHGGRWVLRSSQPDERLDAFVRVVARTFPRPARHVDDGRRPSELVGESPALVESWRRLIRIGRREVPVLVLGETGTGKEMAAREVHRASARASGPYLPVNCAAVSETLVLSELFGHAKGAFTGADREHIGHFEWARGGTLFLDEIGDLPATAQGMLLRALQEREIRRLGENQPRPVDVRIVAATNCDLEERIRVGRFREDLFYRLDVGRVVMPPLRERGRDALLLAEHFLAEIDSGLKLSEAAQQRLLSHPWPGNVRQLRGAIERAAALVVEDQTVLDLCHLDLRGEPQVAPLYHEWLRAAKRARIGQELEACGGKQAAAARRLGISRQLLSYLVRQLGL